MTGSSMDLDQELMRAEVESVSSDNTVASGTNGNVQVVVRVRPPSTRERDQGYLKCVGVDSGAHSLTLNFRPQARTFTFDYVADETVNQEEIFAAVGKPITDACLQGYHCCLIAYGQTGAGKTFTMEGPDSDSSSGNSPGFAAQAKANAKRHEKRGLIPRILDYIFQRMASEKTQNCKDVEFVVKCSYLQIYNEQVSDLLDPASLNLTIHEDAKSGMYVEGLQEVVVPTAEATYGVFRRGSENRHVGMTAMNLESSRSHSVFTVVVESQRRNDGGVMNRRTSRFYLVDLAGSERQKHAESAGIRLKEAGSINKSLSALGNVIKALVDISEGKIRHVPYRDSKLTFLLKDALGGNSKCTLIANISPAEKNIDETLSTLKFAQRAKLIHNTAIVNEDMFGNPAVMGEEIRRLRLEIAALRANIGSGPATDHNPMGTQETPLEISRVSRLEHIISQSVKRSLEAERKADSEIRKLRGKLDAMQLMCERLDRTSQCQKMILRLRENTIKRLENGRLNFQSDDVVKSMGDEMDLLRKQIEHHPDVVRFKMELDLCKDQLFEYEDERKDEDSLQSQIGQLENYNQTLRIEFQEMVEEKTNLVMELIEVKKDRENCQSQLAAVEDQFVRLREAVEKYRLEAAEAVQKCEKAEEKLQECTREQDEVWRRCNLAEAQATESAQQLNIHKSQADKMKKAFFQQSKLQEDMFTELQKATDELQSSKNLAASLQTQLDQFDAIRAQMDMQLKDSEAERNKTTGSLEEMVTACERLASACNEKDASHAEVSGRLEQAELNIKSLEEKILALNLSKIEAENSRDALVSQQEQSIAQAVKEEQRLCAERYEKLQADRDAEFLDLKFVMDSHLAKVEELGKLAEHQANSIRENEALHQASDAEASDLRRQLEVLNAEILEQKLTISDLSKGLESSNAQLSSLSVDKEAIESKISEAEQMFSQLEAVKVEREEIQTKLLETTSLLMEAKTDLESLTVEHQSLKCTEEEAQRKLLELSSSFEAMRKKLEALEDEKVSMEAELRKRTEDLDTVKQKGAVLEVHNTELTEIIESLRGDVSAMETMKSEFLEKTKEVEALERINADQNHKVIVAENACKITQEECSRVLTSVQSLESEKKILSQKLADLEIAQTTTQNVIDRLEEEKLAFLSRIDDLQIEKKAFEAETVNLKSLLSANEAAMNANSVALEEMRSSLIGKAEELQKLEAQVFDQTDQIGQAEKAQVALENDCSRLVRTVRSLQEDKELLSTQIGALEVASKAMMESIETLRQEKVALQASLNSQLEHSEKNVISQHPTEEDVKDVDIANHVILGETQVCIDPGTVPIDVVVTKMGSLVGVEVENNNIHPDEKGEDMRAQEQETDARLVAALADINDFRSHVAGCETKLDLALKAQVEADEQSLVALSRVKDLETQVTLLTGDCSSLRDALCLANCRASTLEFQSGRCMEHEETCVQVKYQALELEKELESSLSLLENVTVALEGKKSEGIDLLRRLAELSAERGMLYKELEELSFAKSKVDAEHSSMTARCVEMESDVMNLENELQIMKKRLDAAEFETSESTRKLDMARHEAVEMTIKLANADERLSEEHGRVHWLEDLKFKLETRIESLGTEKESLQSSMSILQEQLKSNKGSECVGAGVEERLVVLETETCRLAEEKQALEATFGRKIGSLISENAVLREEIDDLTKKILIRESEIAVLKAENGELNDVIESRTSRIIRLDDILRTTVSDHESELLALTRKVHERESEFGEVNEQNSKFVADLQELRDEIQYSLGEVEYEFQKHVIDTEARLMNMESQKQMVQNEALQLTSRMSAENAKFAAMLATLEQQVVGHRAKVETWVESFNDLDSELLRMKTEMIKMKDLEGLVKRLQAELAGAVKSESEYKQEVAQLRTRIAEQAKKTNPFSWNSTSGTLPKLDTKMVHGAQVLTGSDSMPKEDFVPKFAAQQKKRVALSTKERPSGKSKTSYSKQPNLSTVKVVGEPHSSPSLSSSTAANILQGSRSQSRLRNASANLAPASTAERSKRPALSMTHSASHARQPLRSISTNTGEINRRTPASEKPDFNGSRCEKLTKDSTPFRPARNNKRPRLAL